MRTLMPSGKPGAALIAVLAVAMSAGCRPKGPETPPAPVPPEPEVSVAMPPVRDAASVPGAGDATAMNPAAADASRVAQRKPTVEAANEPDLAGMSLARASSKLGVPVDLRYQFEDTVETGRPVTLHLAAVPRVEGSNLSVSVRETAGIDAAAGAITARKADASRAYRQQMLVTRQADAATELRVLVTMDVPEGSAFGYFSVPLTADPAR